MTAANHVIQSLWIGKELGPIQQMCIKSFLKQGHEFHLYTYDDVKNIPAGTVLKNAHVIAPYDRVKEFYGPAQFYDYFAYLLLYKLGGWSVGMDIICLQPFDHLAEYVFPTDDSEEYYITNAVMKVPAGSAIMFSAYLAVTGIDTAATRWDATGPVLLHRLVLEHDLKRFVVPGRDFDAVSWSKLSDGTILKPNVEVDLSNSYAIHFRGSMWDGGPNSVEGLSTTVHHDPKCLWERLRAEYEV